MRQNEVTEADTRPLLPSNSSCENGLFAIDWGNTAHNGSHNIKIYGKKFTCLADQPQQNTPAHEGEKAMNTLRVNTGRHSIGRNVDARKSHRHTYLWPNIFAKAFHQDQITSLYKDLVQVRVSRCRCPGKQGHRRLLVRQETREG